MGDPGCILHEGIGKVDLMLIAIENGPHRVVHAGPTMSHYEFESPINHRMSDSEWKAQIIKGVVPERPDWTDSYLVP